MINSVSNSSPVNQWRPEDPPPVRHPAKTKKEEPHDSVELSQQAKAAAAQHTHKRE